MTRIWLFAAAIAVGSLLKPASCAAEDSVVVLPTRFTLDGENAEQHLLVERLKEGEFIGNLIDGVTLDSSNPNVVVIEDNVARPVSNGQATIIAVVTGEQFKADVTVVGMEQPTPRSFRNDVLPVFAKVGCNTGSCHGALAGKGGFKLSLHGYNPSADFARIVQEARGRRIERLDPGRSLILAKPSGAIPHKGGLRFDVDSPAYWAIAEWVAQGAPPPGTAAAKVDHLEILPQRMLLTPETEQQIIVQAFYTDGRVRDVTRWAKYESTDTTVGSIDAQGSIRVLGHGAGAVTAWFDSKIAIARVTVPFDNPVDKQLFAAEHDSSSFIDRLVLDQLEQLHLVPAPLAGDATFIRRAYIDTIGTLPMAGEVREFLADRSADKRMRLTDELIARPEYVDYWAYKWSDVLLVNGQLLRPNAVKAYYLWIREQVEKNTPWDEFARQILTAQGDAFENGATNFYALHQDAETMTENVCQAFLGLSIGCAKCHNHPLEKWTNDQYYAMANLFARVRGKGWGGDPRGGEGARTVYVATRGDLLQPSSGKPQLPTPLDGEPLDIEWPGDRRVPLSDWLTSPENPYFARAIVNRVWANFFGVGLVEQVDDMRVTNPASNERLLATTAAFLVENNFDLRVLMKEILRSRTYQRSSQPLAGNSEDKRFYSRYYPRRMPAEVLLDAISQVTNVPSEFTEISFPSSDKYETDFYPKGTRSLQLYDSAVLSHFLKSFGRNSRTITCECERTNTPSIVQVLHISNGDTINAKLSCEGNRIDALLDAGLADQQLIEQAYLFALARQPTADELSQLLPLLAEFSQAAYVSRRDPVSNKASVSRASDSREGRRVVLEDIFWGILSSREFLFNH